MPWQNNNDSSGGGGPWGSGGGGGSDGGGSGGGTGGTGSGSGGPPKSPWGEGPPRRPTPRGPTGRGDFDDFLRRSQDKLRGSMPGGGAQLANVPWVLIAAVILGVWLFFTATYRVQAQERGVVMRFGKYIETTGPGFHVKLPAPIDSVILPKVEQVNSVDIGGSEGATENLMLTGDQNIIDIDYAVRWKNQEPRTVPVRARRARADDPRGRRSRDARRDRPCDAERRDRPAACADRRAGPRADAGDTDS